MAELDALTSVRSGAMPEDPIDWRAHAGVLSWSAVFGGAVAATAFGLILLTLGTGLGLATLSPWRAVGESGASFGFAAVIWVCVTQILASGLGGYLAGRLRHRWPFAEADEVYFRDTAHGFLTWALATIVTAALFATVLPAASRAGAHAVADALPSAGLAADRGDAAAATNRWPVGYLVDALFRAPAASAAASSASPAVAPSSAIPSSAVPAAPAVAASAASSVPSAVSNASAPAAIAPPSATASAGANTNTGANTNANTAQGAVISPVSTPVVATTVDSSAPSAAAGVPEAAGLPPKGEVTRIFLNSVATGDALSAADTIYVARLVSRYTGLAPQAAQVRVAATYARLQQKVTAMQDAAKAAADKARHAGVYVALWLFVSLLLGAFSASLAAVLGGRLRDV